MTEKPISERARRTVGYLSDLVQRYANPDDSFNVNLSLMGRELFEQEVESALDAARAEGAREEREKIAALMVASAALGAPIVYGRKESANHAIRRWAERIRKGEL